MVNVLFFFFLFLKKVQFLTLIHVISVTLSTDDKSPFKGFLVLAHRVKGDREMPMGTFTKFPENKAKATYCIDAQNVSTMLRG